MKTLAKIIRIITIAPIMALLLITLLLILRPEAYNGLYMYFVCFACLCVIPSLSYPIEKKWHWCGKFHPDFDGRKSSRRLAIYFSLFGYAVLTLISFLTHQPRLLNVLCLTYLFSGFLIFLFSVVIKYDASGHACGFIGPVAFLSYNVNWYFLFLLPLFLVIFWSSLKLNRHSVEQVLLGGIFPVVSMIIALLIL